MFESFCVGERQRGENKGEQRWEGKYQDTASTIHNYQQTIPACFLLFYEPMKRGEKKKKKKSASCQLVCIQKQDEERRRRRKKNECHSPVIPSTDRVPSGFLLGDSRLRRHDISLQMPPVIPSNERACFAVAFLLLLHCFFPLFLSFFFDKTHTKWTRSLSMEMGCK